MAGFPQGDVRERLPHARPGDERGASGREPGRRRHRVPHRGGGSAVRRAAAVRRGGLHAAGPGGARGRLPVGRRGRRRPAARAVAGAGHAPVRGRVGGEAGAGAPADRRVPRGPACLGALGRRAAAGAGSCPDHRGRTAVCWRPSGTSSPGWRCTTRRRGRGSAGSTRAG